MAQLDVTNYGADPSGASDSTGAIDSALSDAGSGDTVFLPNGTYRTSGGHSVGSEAVVGESRDGVVLQVESDGNLFATRSSGWEIRRMKWDMTRGTGNLNDMSNNVWVRNTLQHNGVMSDIWIHGVQGRYFNSGGPPQVFAVQDASGTIRLERIYGPQGTGVPGDMNGVQWLGSFSDWGFSGTLEIVECHLERAANNFLYMGGGPFDVDIRRCYFANNNVGIRLPSGGDVTIANTVIDNTGGIPGQDHSQSQYDGGVAGRGLWLNGSSSVSVSVDGCEIDTNGYSGINMDDGILSVTNSTVVGSPAVTASGGTVQDSCVDGSISGVSTSNVSSGCSPNLSPPINLSAPYAPGSGGSDGGGGANGGTGDTLQTRTVVLEKFDGVTLSGPVSYSFVVPPDGSAVQETRSWGASVDDSDMKTVTSTGYHHVQGTIQPGDRLTNADVWEVTGPVGLFTHSPEGTLDVWVDNSQTSPTQLMDDSGGAAITRAEAGLADGGTGDGGTDGSDGSGGTGDGSGGSTDGRTASGGIALLLLAAAAAVSVMEE